jgi:DUF1680 family protein
MKTLPCTCGQVISGETGAELYTAVEAHLTDHAARYLEPGADALPGQAEHEEREEQ